MYAALSQEVSINFVPYGFASVGNFCSDKLPWVMTYSHWAKNLLDNWRWEWRAALWVPTWREGVRWKYRSSETFHQRWAGNTLQISSTPWQQWSLKNIIIVATSPSCAGKNFTRLHQHHSNSNHWDISSSLQHLVLEKLYKISSTPWQKWSLSSKFISCARLTRFHQYQYLCHHHRLTTQWLSHHQISNL